MLIGEVEAVHGRRNAHPLRVLDILKFTLECALGLEEAKTMELKLIHGFNSTRGGTWNAPHDHAPPKWFIEDSEVDIPSKLESTVEENFFKE